MLEGFWTNMFWFILIVAASLAAVMTIGGAHDICDTIETAKLKYGALMHKINQSDSWRREDIDDLKKEACRCKCKQIFFTILLIFIILLWVFGITLAITISKNTGGK
jgi:uncharacterized membrane protein YhaH (DUF805 family)